MKSVYAFEFLGLKAKDAVEENDLESALLDHLQDFMMEMGNGYCLEARQKKILIGDEYFFIDLVFYHRILKCHVLGELKNTFSNCQKRKYLKHLFPMNYKNGTVSRFKINKNPKNKTMQKLTFKFGAEVYTWYMNNNGETYKDQLGLMINIIAKAGFTGIQPIFSWMGKLSDPVLLKEKLKEQGIELAAVALALDWNGKEETEEERIVAYNAINLL